MVMWNRQTPRLTGPWPETAEQWALYATCSQMVSEHRREQKRNAERNHRREIQAMLRAGGVVLGCMLAMGVAYLGIWWLWALVGA